MASILNIGCLTDEQKQQLQNVQPGDYLKFDKHYDSPQYETWDAGRTSPDLYSDPEDDEDDDEEAEVTSVQGSVNGDEAEGEGVAEESNESHSPEPMAQAEDVDEDAIPSQCVYLVKSLLQGEDGSIEDLELVFLTWATEVIDDPHMFYIYGAELHSTHHDCADDECEAVSKLTDLHEQYGLESYTLLLKPDGFQLAHEFSQLGCPAECNEGWLESLDALKNILPAGIYASPAVLDHNIVCPCCLGLDVLMEQQALRGTLEAFSTVMNHFDAVFHYHALMNQRRANMGYDHYQYDEHDWNMHFDDMDEADDEDSDSGHGGGGDGWENYAEAMDPNSTAPTARPASTETIAALPRIAYKKVDVVGADEDANKCMICLFPLEDDQIVLGLPCPHLFHEECVTFWLKERRDDCPLCRKEVVAGVQKVDGNDGEGNDELVDAVDGMSIDGEHAAPDA